MEKGIYKNMKCHHWNGDMLVKSVKCKHKLRKGLAVKTLIVPEEDK